MCIRDRYVASDEKSKELIRQGALMQGDNLEDLFMNVVRKNQKAGEIHGYKDACRSICI